MIIYPENKIILPQDFAKRNYKKKIVLGDTHGDIQIVSKLAIENPDKTIIQIGDFGIGFMPISSILYIEQFNNIKFIAGNHDNRKFAKSIPNYLGDFGEFEDTFFVSGADSIDKNRRVEGVSWWNYEELNHQECNECIDAYKKSKTDIILAHDLPQSFVESYLLIYDATTTRRLLDELIKIRKPKLFISGHWHRSMNVTHKDIQFRVLDINEPYELP